MVFQMDEHTFHVIDLERTSDALPILARAHHEMFDEQLAASIEQIGERHLPLRRIEDVRFLNLDPGQCTALATQLVALSRELLFLGQECSSRLEPFLS